MDHYHFKTTVVETYIWLPGCEHLENDPVLQTGWKTWTFASILPLVASWKAFTWGALLWRVRSSWSSSFKPQRNKTRFSVSMEGKNCETCDGFGRNPQWSTPELPKSQSWQNCLNLLLLPCTAGSGCNPAQPATVSNNL